ncbi:MAG: bifunctional folylpolyglutamate synthase/dihydrofolate synthase [Rhodospirillaceae bacterium]|nr:bifunctional folylpolyglutamate synthase/dihydrofolate synthase [Rhodospirillaceae bacterium]MYB13136.1 bifunctional folylpolyglutamate synthase/dihydrofolate synthase [Rhodospirillaceae bacterium]MYI48305.1 bifunctional folylpolyglutamate synthase/dihydrofolate synthase [Rhodospirillaceae bacterium]
MSAATVDRLLERFTALHPRVIDLSLGRIEALLAKLGRPQDRLPPVIHVSGTNGKGSVLAFCRAAFEAAGRSVHQYVSPHLVRFNERIVLNGRDIGDAALVEILEAADRANDGAPITFFEITTAAAFKAFAETPADVLLLETGLGGRLDATNVVARPAATGIVSIGLDHQGYLGDTVEAVAAEKAGILRAGVPAVIGDLPPAALDVVERAAGAARAPLLKYGETWRFGAAAAPGSGGSEWSYTGPGRECRLPPPALPGGHQTANAAFAVALADASGVARLEDRHWAQAMQVVTWPGRLQRVGGGALAGQLQPGQELWLDGAHNPPAARALADWVQTQARPVHAILGLLETKDPGGVLAALAPACASLTAVPVPGHKCHPADRLAAAARACGASETAAAPDLEHALDLAAARAAGGDTILVCGSLYLIGQALALSEG